MIAAELERHDAIIEWCRPGAIIFAPARAEERMSLAQAERALDEIAMRERHIMHVLNLANSTADAAEFWRLLKLATDMTVEAREIEERAKLALVIATLH